MDSVLKKILLQNISRLMSEKGFTKRSLSLAVGKADNYIGTIYSGKLKDPSLGTIDKVARELGVTIDKILTLEEVLDNAEKSAEIVAFESAPKKQSEIDAEALIEASRVVDGVIDRHGLVDVGRKVKMIVTVKLHDLLRSNAGDLEPEVYERIVLALIGTAEESATSQDTSLAGDER